MLHEVVKIEEFGEFGLKPGQFIVTNRDLERPWSSCTPTRRFC